MTATWRDLLDDQTNPDWTEEIDEFEAQLHLRAQGKIDEAVFAETRLRRGAYGQRYDNGKRFDGYGTRELPLDTDKPTKGSAVGRARHAAHQAAVRRLHPRPDRGDGRLRRGERRRDPARDNAAGHPAALRPPTPPT